MQPRLRLRVGSVASKAVPPSTPSKAPVAKSLHKPSTASKASHVTSPKAVQVTAWTPSKLTPNTPNTPSVKALVASLAHTQTPIRLFGGPPKLDKWAPLSEGEVKTFIAGLTEPPKIAAPRRF